MLRCIPFRTHLRFIIPTVQKQATQPAFFARAPSCSRAKATVISWVQPLQSHSLFVTRQTILC